MDGEGITGALIIAVLSLPLVAWASPRFARLIQARQHIRPEGPSSHTRKAGTPTMGGVVVLLPIALGTLILWGLGQGFSIRTGFVLAATFLAGLVGLLDDLRSQRENRSLGFLPHQTLLLQGVCGLLLSLFLVVIRPALVLPFSGMRLEIPIWAAIPLLILAFMGTVNGMNLTDGLDGLATGAWVLSLLGLLPLLWAHSELLRLTILGLGAGLGFLWANAYPAQVFLGNVGSMGLGGLLFALAFAADGVLFLPLAAGLLVVEALSVILQVASFKLTGVRLLKMSPLHHHLEDAPVSWPHRLKSPNWPEPKVVARLLVVAGGFALLSVLAAL